MFWETPQSGANLVDSQAKIPLVIFVKEDPSVLDPHLPR